MANAHSACCHDAMSIAAVPATAASKNSGRGPRRSSARPATIPPAPVMTRVALKIAPSAASGHRVPARIGPISTPYA